MSEILYELKAWLDFLSFNACMKNVPLEKSGGSKTYTSRATGELMNVVDFETLNFSSGIF
jgi:hypothetical protein